MNLKKTTSETKINSKENSNTNTSSISSEKATKTWNILVLINTFLLLVGGAFLVYQMQHDFAQFRMERLSSTWGFVFFAIASSLFVYKAGFFIYQLYLYFRYKPVSSVTNDELPTVTVIVPAYNEGKQVWATLKSLAKSDYPAEKIQLLAIDDGSKDDTWYWMQEAKKQLGDRVAIYQQPENKGKRHVL